MNELKKLSEHLIFLHDKKLIKLDNNDLKDIDVVHSGEFETYLAISDLWEITKLQLIEMKINHFNKLLSTALDFKEID